MSALKPSNANGSAKFSKSILPENYIYISHLDENFQFWRLPCTPDSITDTMGSTFSQTPALGRSAPVYTYSSSGPRAVQISLKFHRDMMEDINMGVSNVSLNPGETYTDKLIKALQSISVPKYNLSNKAVEPPLVALRLSNEIFVKGVVTSGIGLTYQLPILSDGKYAIISLSLTIEEVDPYDASTVFKNGSFRGVVQTMKKGMNLD